QRSIGKFLDQNNAIINNEYLTYIAKEFEVDEINITDEKGKIIFSNLQSSLGQVFKSDHISQSVLKGEKSELMENIRKSNETNDYYKYGYVRGKNGGFIQVGILANKIQKFNDSVGYQSLVTNIKKGENVVYALFIDKNLKAVAHSETDRIGIILDDLGSKTAAVEGKPYSSTFFYEKEKVNVYDVLVPVKKDGQLIGAIDIGFSLKNIEATIKTTIFIVCGISILAFVIISIVLTLIANNVIKPLKGLVNSSKEVANGELYHEIEAERKDEVGELAKSFKDMIINLREVITSIQGKSNAADEMAAHLTNASNQLSTASNEVTCAIQHVAEGASDQANDLMYVLDQMAVLGSEIDEIHEKMDLVKDNVSSAECKANGGKENIDLILGSFTNISIGFKSVNDKVNALAATISQIGNITEVINSISDQTNLLALNAAIEAARAGEMGRGFAVVADEVRKLAQESRGSTEQIKKLVLSITKETEAVISTSDEVGDLLSNQIQSVEQTIGSFKDILEAVSNITPLIGNTYESIESTLNSKNIVVEKISSVSAVAQEMSASSEEISASSEEMLASAQEVSQFAVQLNDIAVELNHKVSEFKLEK
ncbi:hypothetical protein M918_11415, partial [Clostridium sp. BL8]|uniref:methyl-accepting chemotaxis protein n=1 Tax=Clostridium sp. BL8 TaxID=1354301 RepID=UPI000389EAFF